MAEHMFVRIGTEKNVRMAKAMLAQFDPRIEEKDGLTTIYAPDGDIVFQAIPKDGKTYICRYHDEVFSRGGVA